MTFGLAKDRPTLLWLAYKMAKVAIRHPRLIPHLLATLRGAARLRWQLRLDSGDKPGTFIAMIEHLGDVIAAEPVARYAARQYAGDRVTWVCRAPYRAAVEGFSAVDRIVTVGCMTEWLLLWATATRGGRNWDLHISARACLTCGFSFNKPKDAGKITYDTYFNLGNLLKVNCLVAGIPVLDEAPRVLPDSTSLAVADSLELPARFVVIHCKSNEDRKDWPAHKWRELIEWLTEKAGLFVCEVGTSPVAITSSTALTRNLCGTLAVMQTAAVIAKAALFIGIDSGPAHLANAAGIPGVILLGRYHLFDRYTPYSGGYGDGSVAELVRTSGFASEIPVEDVVAAAARRLGSLGARGFVSQANPSL
jgi:ADP-heptose:LPS heptosyltransferase